MMAQFEQLGRVADKLKGIVTKMAEAQNKQRGRTQQALDDRQLKGLSTISAIKLKELKAQAQLAQSAQKHRAKLVEQAQDMIVKDATSAADIRRADRTAAAQAVRSTTPNGE